MSTFLIWNLAICGIGHAVSGLAMEHEVNILLAAENKVTPESFLKLRHPIRAVCYHFLPPPVPRETEIEVYESLNEHWRTGSHPKYSTKHRKLMATYFPANQVESARSHSKGTGNHPWPINSEHCAR
jgi:hypothetical protein